MQLGDQIVRGRISITLPTFWPKNVAADKLGAGPSDLQVPQHEKFHGPPLRGDYTGFLVSIGQQGCLTKIAVTV